MCSSMLVLAGVDTTSGFIAELNSKWAASDYQGMKSSINSRLQLKGSSDLIGLMAKCDFYTTIETDASILQSTVAQVKQARDSINWAQDKEALDILNATLALYDNPQDAQAKGFISGLTPQQLQSLRTDYPNQYPATVILQRFGVIQYP